MEYRIAILSEKKLVGMRQSMSFNENKTGELWRKFMSRRKEINNIAGTDLYSLQIFPASFFDGLNPDAKFEKWAAIEVTDFVNIPPEMELLTVEEGLYAVFHYKGLPENGEVAFRYIFGTWLPQSEYELDDRPHFEILGEKYKNNDPASEEDIWIPVKFKM